MKRGDVKLMIDRLVMLTEPEVGDAIEMLGALADENEIGKQMCGRLMAELGEKNDQITKLRSNLDRHMEVIVNGRNANEMLCAKYNTLLNAVKNLRDQKGRHNTQLAYERLMTLIREEK